MSPGDSPVLHPPPLLLLALKMLDTVLNFLNVGSGD